MKEAKITNERKVRKRAEREERILKAAEQLILVKGFANTTIDDIAVKADVSKGAVYLHYQTKDDIYFSIVVKALETMRDMFLEAANEKEAGLEKFRAIGYSFYEYTIKFPEYSNILYDANSPKPCHSLTSEERCQSLNDEIGRIMIESIKTGMKDGSIRSDVDPIATTIIISSSLQGLLRTLIAEKETMKSMGLEENHLVDLAIDLYGRSLMDPSGPASKPTERKKTTQNSERRSKRRVRKS
jgi:TetR/AcrR family transcriptional regulator